MIPLRGEMSQSDKRVPVLEEKGDRFAVDEVYIYAQNKTKQGKFIHFIVSQKLHISLFTYAPIYGII